MDREERSNGTLEFKHGTLYPILHKLEKEGLIEGVWSEEGKRDERRHYGLTQKGREYARAQGAAWRTFVDSLFGIIGRTDE